MTTRGSTRSALPATKLPQLSRYQPLLVSLLALALVGGVWFGFPTLSIYARIAFITFGLAVLGWVFTKINDTYIALTAALVFTLTGIDEPDEFFETLGDSTIWLLLASFMIAAAVKASGLSERLTLAVAVRARTVSRLFYLLTAVLLVTAFVIPATSGRAALMVPIFVAISSVIGNQRIVRALALLFPTIILLSAVASLIGAGAHLVTVEILRRMGGEEIGFGDWLLLGLPFALVSCFASTWAILHLFLNRGERSQPLQLRRDQLAVQDEKRQLNTTGKLSRAEGYVIGVVAVLVLLWSTESLHGFNNTIVAILGALAVTAPRFGVIGFKEGIKSVEWNMLLFMAATLELGEALIESGGAEQLVQSLFSVLQGSFATSALFVTSTIAIVSLLSHLLITSRTARSSVLVPLVVLLAISLGYNPTTMAFLSTAAAGFCLTLPVSAKPVAMFNQLKQPTYSPQDLLRLSGWLLPLHFGLLLVFAFFVWPALGLTMERATPQERPQAPVWHEGDSVFGDPGTTAGSEQAPRPTPFGVFGPNQDRTLLPPPTAIPTPTLVPTAIPTATPIPPAVDPIAPVPAAPSDDDDDDDDAAPVAPFDDDDTAPLPEGDDDDAVTPDDDDDDGANAPAAPALLAPASQDNGPAAPLAVPKDDDDDNESDDDDD